MELNFWVFIFVVSAIVLAVCAGKLVADFVRPSKLRRSKRLALDQENRENAARMDRIARRAFERENAEVEELERIARL